MRGIEILISHLGQGLRSLFLLILLYSERTVHFGIVQMYNYSVEFLSLLFSEGKPCSIRLCLSYPLCWWHSWTSLCSTFPLLQVALKEFCAVGILHQLLDVVVSKPYSVIERATFKRKITFYSANIIRIFCVAYFLGKDNVMLWILFSWAPAVNIFCYKF